MLINTSPDKNKKILAGSFKRQNKKKWVKRKKNKNTDETLKIIEKLLHYNKNAQKKFQHASKVDKKNQSRKLELLLK